VFSFLEHSKTGRQLVSYKARRRRLGRQKLAEGSMQTYDIISLSWLEEYVAKGLFYKTFIPADLRRQHIEEVLRLVSSNRTGYRMAVASGAMGQWFLTYRMPSAKVCYISRQYHSSHFTEPIGVFTEEEDAFETYEAFFVDNLKKSDTKIEPAHVTAILQKALASL
jgi:hypothetical protein